jgi:hypothetical protein
VNWYAVVWVTQLVALAFLALVWWRQYQIKRGLKEVRAMADSLGERQQELGALVEEADRSIDAVLPRLDSGEQP